jgi:CxxC motif-containing protein
MSETTRELTCIGCPLGCSITVTMNGTDVVSVTGNTCPRGDAYARKEVTNPTRIVTSTVRVEGGISPMVNVKTASDIPKAKIFECASALKNVVVTAPVKIGDVVLSNVAGSHDRTFAFGNELVVKIGGNGAVFVNSTNTETNG